MGMYVPAHMHRAERSHAEHMNTYTDVSAEKLWPKNGNFGRRSRKGGRQCLQFDGDIIA